MYFFTVHMDNGVLCVGFILYMSFIHKYFIAGEENIKTEEPKAAAEPTEVSILT